MLTQERAILYAVNILSADRWGNSGLFTFVPMVNFTLIGHFNTIGPQQNIETASWRKHIATCWTTFSSIKNYVLTHSHIYPAANWWSTAQIAKPSDLHWLDIDPTPLYQIDIYSASIFAIWVSSFLYWTLFITWVWATCPVRGAFDHANAAKTALSEKVRKLLPVKRKSFEPLASSPIGRNA